MKVTKRKMTRMVKTSMGTAKTEKTLGKPESEVVIRSEMCWRNKLAERRENGE
jgi:hypothetical protein